MNIPAYERQNSDLAELEKRGFKLHQFEKILNHLNLVT